MCPIHVFVYTALWTYTIIHIQNLLMKGNMCDSCNCLPCDMCTCKLQILIITEWFCDWWSTTRLWLKSPQLGDQFQQCVRFMPLFAMWYMYKQLQIIIIITKTFGDGWSTTWLWLTSPQFQHRVCNSCNCLPCGTCTCNCWSLQNDYATDDQRSDCGWSLLKSPQVLQYVWFI